jgi:hypothetical protein
MSHINAIFWSLGQVIFAPGYRFKGQCSKLRGIFRIKGRGRALLFALASCLTIAMSACGAGVSVPLGSGGLQVSPGTINFGNVPVGHEVDSSVSVTNSNASPIAVSQVNVSGQPFSLLSNASVPISIPAGGIYNLKIGFKPASTVAYSGQITLIDTSAKMIAQVPMQGAGASPDAPQLTVSAASLNFGSLALNTSTTQSLTLTSTGTAPVTVNTAAITGTGFTIVGGSLPVTLNPTQSMTLQVQYLPTATGAASGQITISSNSSSGSTVVVALSGTSTAAPSPQLAVSAASLSFGSVTVNTATTQSLTLTSTGTAPVTVSSATITGAGFTIVGGSVPVTLNPTQAVTLQVQFLPTAIGTASGQITISSDSSTGSTAVVALSGTSTAAPSPQLTVSAASLSFGSVTVNTATAQSLTLTSTGTAPVTVNTGAITGSGFTIVGGSVPVTLNPTQSMTLQVQFLPTSAGTANGQITISSNSSTGSTAVVALSGTSTAAPSPQLTVSATSLSFGSVTVNTATTQTLTLTSTGTAPVTVNSAAITGAGFTIVGGSVPVTLNPGQAVTLQVQFLPTSAGTANGQITISSNSSSGSTAVVALSGTSTAAPSPQLTVSSTSLSFGSVTVNTSTTQTLTLTSTGTAPVTVNSAATTGAGFTIVGGSVPVTLNPGQAVTLQVQFLPTSAGTANGQITISSNSTSGSTAVVALSGTGTAVSHEVDLSWDAPANSPDPVAGYNIYRATGTGSLVLINSSPDSAVVYVDSAVVSGATYSYVVKSVDPGGVESVPSNQITVTIP